MPGKRFGGALPPLTAEDERRADRLRADVEALAGKIGPRDMNNAAALAQAKDYVRSALEGAGYDVHGEDYDVDGRVATNVVAERRGTSQPSEIVVVGAHYDTVPGAPGADDNTSGVAAMLELARSLKDFPPARTLRFVAFVNEEPPYFWTNRMGSLVYARACAARKDDIVAMLSLETLGYYADAKGSQKYPFPMGLFYGDRGDFIGFVGNTSSRALTRRVIGTFRERASFPSEGAALPWLIAGVGWSDQWSFWRAGYPGVMVTDTAPFRNPHYHTASDTPDTLDYARFSRVVGGLRPVIASLAD
jgi:Zn-dependent M28 family amino/carboxypeptidase